MQVWTLALGESLLEEALVLVREHEVSLRSLVRQGIRAFAKLKSQPKVDGTASAKWREWWNSLSKDEQRAITQKAATARWKSKTAK